MRTSAIIVTQASDLPIGIPDVACRRVGVIVSEWFNCDITKGPIPSVTHSMPDDAMSMIITQRGAVVYVRESFQDIAALLGAAEGEPR